MICPNCKSENDDGARFCNHCGAALFDRPDKLIADSLEEIHGIDAEIPKDLSNPKFIDALTRDDAVTQPVDKPAAPPSATAPQASDLLTNPNLGASAPIPFKGESLAPVVAAMFTRKSDDPSVPATPTWDTSPIDFTGFEQLVDSSYVPPSPSAHTGDTIQMPPLKAKPSRRSRDFRASVSERDDKRLRKEEKRQERELKHAQKRAERERAAAMRKYEAARGDEQAKGEPEAMASADAEAPAKSSATNPRTIDTASVEVLAGTVGDDKTTAVIVEETTDEEPSAPLTTDSTLDAPAIEEIPRDPSEAMPPAEKSHPRRIWIPIVIAIVVVAAAVVGLTYYFQLWGGKVVPDVVGQNEAEARGILEHAGFTVRAVSVKSDDTPDTVLLTDPAGGARTAEGGEVVMHVAMPRTVPNVVGMQRSEAETLLADDGFTHVTITLQKSDEAENSVLSVNPEAGTEARATTPITVTVADPFVVPTVEGLRTGEAEDAISDAGFVVKTVPYYTEEIPDGTAVSTDPPAGTKLHSGSTVTLNVARSRSAELIDATTAFLEVGSSISVSGGDTPSGTYVINSLDSVSYNGDDTTSFTITATPYGITNFWFLLTPEVSYGEPITISGTATWSGSGDLVSVFPNIARVS